MPRIGLEERDCGLWAYIYHQILSTVGSTFEWKADGKGCIKGRYTDTGPLAFITGWFTSLWLRLDIIILSTPVPIHCRLLALLYPSLPSNCTYGQLNWPLQGLGLRALGNVNSRSYHASIKHIIRYKSIEAVWKMFGTSLVSLAHLYKHWVFFITFGGK